MKSNHARGRHDGAPLSLVPKQARRLHRRPPPLQRPPPTRRPRCLGAGIACGAPRRRRVRPSNTPAPTSSSCTSRSTSPAPPSSAALRGGAFIITRASPRASIPWHRRQHCAAAPFTRDGGKFSRRRPSHPVVSVAWFKPRAGGSHQTWAKRRPGGGGGSRLYPPPASRRRRRCHRSTSPRSRSNIFVSSH